MSREAFDPFIIDVCVNLDIGTPQSTPQSVTGGLLHRLWRVETEAGTFAIKVLNPEIMVRHDAKQNYRIAEQVANAVRLNGINAVTARTVGDDPWVEIADKYFMVFDWVEGQTLRPDQCTPKQTRDIGDILCRLHNLNIEIDDVELPTVSTVSDETWKSHIDQAERAFSCWGFSPVTMLHDVLTWSQLHARAIGRLGERFVVSHRDLDTKNVIWTSENVPYLVDWEMIHVYANWVDEVAH